MSSSSLWVGPSSPTQAPDPISLHGLDGRPQGESRRAHLRLRTQAWPWLRSLGQREATARRRRCACTGAWTGTGAAPSAPGSGQSRLRLSVCVICSGHLGMLAAEPSAARSRLESGMVGARPGVTATLWPLCVLRGLGTLMDRGCSATVSRPGACLPSLLPAWSSVPQHTAHKAPVLVGVPCQLPLFCSNQHRP